MIKIHKQTPPKELVDLQTEAANRHLTPDDAYRLLVNPLKNSVMQQLMVEQGHLCAYCMRRLPDDRTMPETIAKVSIEHWYPRNPPNGNDVGQGLDYQNMLAVCSGNRGHFRQVNLCAAVVNQTICLVGQNTILHVDKRAHLFRRKA